VGGGFYGNCIERLVNLQLLRCSLKLLERLKKEASGCCFNSSFSYHKELKVLLLEFDFRSNIDEFMRDISTL
jgi:hypothetical protein